MFDYSHAPFRLVIGITLCVVLCWQAATSLGQDDPTMGKNAERAKFLLAGVQKGRESLRSGQYRASGRIVYAKRLPQPWTIFCAFDFAEGRLRFDQDLPEEVVGREGLRDHVIRYARTAQQSLLWNEPNTGGRLNILLPDAALTSELYAFDIRGIGIAFTHSIVTSTPFEEEFRFLSNQQPIEEVEDLDAHVSKITWRLFTEQRKVLWIDKSKGYAPVRMEVVSDMPDEETLKLLPKWWKPVAFSCDVSWKRMSKVWVPTAMKMEQAEGVLYELAFDWEKVNEPLDEKLFTIEGLDLDLDTYIDDYRLGGRPISLGTIRDRMATVRVPAARRSSTWIWFVAGLVSILVIGLVVRRWARLRHA